MRSLMALTAAAITLACASQARAQGQPAGPAAIEEAKKHMKAGAAFYNDPNGHKCEEALREFIKAYRLSGSLNALKGMAICNLELERDGDAIEQYTTYLAAKGASLDPADKAQVEADLNALKQAVAAVRLSANLPGVRVVDVRTPAKGFPIRNTYTIGAGQTRLGIHPGQHVLTASLAGYPDEIWTVDIANGGAYTHVFEMRRPAPAPVPPMTRPVPPSVYVMGGLTVALAVPWVALAVRAKAKNDDYAKVNGHEDAASLTELRDGVKNANILADVFLGATAASLGTTAILYFTRPSKPSAGRQGSFYLAPRVGLTGGEAVLGGSF